MVWTLGLLSIVILAILLISSMLTLHYIKARHIGRHTEVVRVITLLSINSVVLLTNEEITPLKKLRKSSDHRLYLAPVI
jgi:hypothetical protein